MSLYATILGRFDPGAVRNLDGARYALRDALDGRYAEVESIGRDVEGVYRVRTYFDEKPGAYAGVGSVVLLTAAAPPAGGELLDYAGVAALAGLANSTLRQYRAKGLLPEPDALPAPDRPRWKPETIRTWMANRPGRGAPGRARPGRRK